MGKRRDTLAQILSELEQRERCNWQLDGKTFVLRDFRRASMRLGILAFLISIFQRTNVRSKRCAKDLNKCLFTPVSLPPFVHTRRLSCCTKCCVAGIFLRRVRGHTHSYNSE